MIPESLVTMDNNNSNNTNDMVGKAGKGHVSQKEVTGNPKTPVFAIKFPILTLKNGFHNINLILLHTRGLGLTQI